MYTRMRLWAAAAAPLQTKAKSMSSISSTKHYDYIIVGGGTAGCLLANRLSADAGKSVLLMEAGTSTKYKPIMKIPISYLHTMMNPSTCWCYNTEEQEGLSGRSIGYPRGKVLGGCSSINGMLYLRGARSDYDHWSSVAKDDSWNGESMDEIFDSLS